MPLYNSNSHSRHPNVCNEQQFLSQTTCVLRMSLSSDTLHFLGSPLPRVTQEDVDEYGSVKSAVSRRVVEAEKVCNELNRICLIEFNAIDLI